MEFGAIVGALIGLGAEGEEGAEAGAQAGAEALEDGHVFDEDEVWYVTDSIPNGTAAAIALSSTAGRSLCATRSSAPADSRSPTSGSMPRIWSQWD